MSDQARWRYRLHFHKTDQLRYIGHLDLHRTLERTLRRAQLPMEYSQGFNPRMKLNLSPALPLGCESSTEMADIWLQARIDEEILREKISQAAPPGLSLLAVEAVDLKAPALQTQIHAMEYRVWIESNPPAGLNRAVKSLLDEKELLRTRRGKSYDLRPLIHELEVAHEQHEPVGLRMVLSAGEGSTGRPEEVLMALGLDPAEARIKRTSFYFAEPAEREQS